eukprot:m.16259 g.16259  ORF g.16259 m.16259 type:complete len:65 (+) comp10959_c0_seq1:52-246(+)
MLRVVVACCVLFGIFFVVCSGVCCVLYFVFWFHVDVVQSAIYYLLFGSVHSYIERIDKRVVEPH